MPDQCDFIIVGSGPSGSALASQLATTAKKPSVLLIEAGSDITDERYRINGERYKTFMNPGLDWGYMTTPQDNLKGRSLPYMRGKGLGGSSATNFSCYTEGPRDDYDEWAASVGDDSWRWHNVKERFKSLEAFHADVPEDYQKYANPNVEDHGSKGLPPTLEKDVLPLLEYFYEYGFPPNKDLNSGNPIGIGLSAISAHNGRRTTAHDLLLNAPTNLTVLMDTHIDYVVFRGKTAIGVQAGDKKYFASTDVVLSAGSLDTPRVLLLSGIGPAAELQAHHIIVTQDLPGVGKNLQDHPNISLTIIRNPGTNDRLGFTADVYEAAKEQWMRDKTGPLSTFFCSNVMGFLKLDKAINSTEFQTLDDEEQRHLMEDTVPTYEICTHCPPLNFPPPAPELTYLGIVVICMNPQSRGEIKLQSANPRDVALMDPRSMSHPFDRRVAIEATRDVLEFTDTPSFAKDTVEIYNGPKSRSDDDIWDYIQGVCVGTAHMAGTVKMGRADDPQACVDADCRVKGVENLRVVDMSVVPRLINNHTQSTAYVIGLTAAEKMIAEYHLDW